MLINEFYVLTAGHCVQSNVASQYTIRIGEYNLFQPDVNTIDYAVSKIILHTNYTGLTNKRKAVKNADIALIRSKQPIVLGEFAWPICYFGSEEEEKEGLLELKRASKLVKKNLSKELNQRNNDFVEHQLTEEDLLEDGYFSNILDESNCESYSQADYYQALSGANGGQPSSYIPDNGVAAKHLNSLNRTGSNRLTAVDAYRGGDRSTDNATIQTIKYRTGFAANLLSEDTNKINLNVTRMTSLANLAIVVGWGKRSEKADHYSSYLQKSTLCLIPNKVCEHWYR